jgi:cation diffusion facilitator CzcD-associated flavoprotein CzcO
MTGQHAPTPFTPRDFSAARMQETTRPTARAPTKDFDAVIIGAGFSGMYMLHSLRDKLGLNARVLEAGDGVGGTWYWNRYPGARCDTPSYIYCYTFDRNLVQEWEWSERYPEQDEILRYLEHCAERFDLKPDIEFGKRVNGVEYDDATRRWHVRTEQGDDYTAQFVITAAGCLTASNMPAIPGIDSFQGRSYHTSRWPHEGVDFTARRVAVIGTGATAVQAIPIIAQQAKHLTVFQRTPAFCVPARNGKVDPEITRARKANYDQVVENIRKSFFGFELDFIPKSVLETTPEEREREFDRMWDTGGFEFWLANYHDLFFSQEANDVIAAYLKRKIRETVFDPVVAEKLVPKTYPFGTKRQPLDTNYFETFNKRNVLLVDAATDGPIEAITPKGIRAGGKEYEFDIIVYATGFDAMTGAIKNLAIKGRGGQSLNDLWADGPETYLGLGVAGFPNLFTITGPQSPSAFSNVPVSIEQHVEWITDCIAHLRRHGLHTIEATPQAQREWGEHVLELVAKTLVPGTASWYMGANVPGKPRKFLAYIGPEGVGGYRRTCADVVADGYRGFVLQA